MKCYEITDKTLLEDIRSGIARTLDIRCPKGPKIAREAQGLLTKHDAQILADAINSNKKITGVDLKINKLEAGALGTMIRSLIPCSDFQSLHLEVIGVNPVNIVSDEDIAVLSELIRTSTSLTLLDLSSLLLTPTQQVTVVQACAESQSLEKIRFFYCGIAKEAMNAMSELLQRSLILRSLTLHSNLIESTDLKSLLMTLAGNNKNVLDELSLGCNPLGEASIAALADYVQLPVCKLTSIDIGSTRVLAGDCADSVCKIISGNTQLKSFSCGPIAWGVEALRSIVQALDNNICITELELHGREFFASQRLPAISSLSQAAQSTQELLKEIKQKLDTNKQSFVEPTEINSFEK